MSGITVVPPPTASGGGGGLATVTADAPLSGAGTSGSHLVIASATGSVVGVVKLAGDLGGTAALPTVGNLSHVTNASLPASGIAAVNPSSLTGSGTVPLAGLTGITTTQLSASAAIVAGQVASVNPSVLTGTGTVPIGGIPTGSTSSTVAIGNDSRLSDARTPTAHRSTHIPSGTDDLYLQGGHMPNPSATTPAGRIEAFPSGWCNGATALASGLVFFTEFTAPASITVKTLGTWVTTAMVVGGGSISHSQLHLWSAASGVYTLLQASTDDTTGSFLLAAGLATKTITDTPITAGSRYAIGIDAVFASLGTTPTLPITGLNTGNGFLGKTGFPILSMQFSPITTTVTGPYTGVATARNYWMFVGN